MIRESAYGNPHGTIRLQVGGDKGATWLCIFRTVRDWNRDVPAPPAARIAAVLSLTLWTGVITCGRLIAYFSPG